MHGMLFKDYLKQNASVQVSSYSFKKKPLSKISCFDKLPGQEFILIGEKKPTQILKIICFKNTFYFKLGFL